MDAMQTAGFVLVGVAVGAIGTLIGAGGGFALLPILVYLYPKVPPAVLTAISLSVVFANATSGSIAYARLRRIDVRAGALFALSGLPGSLLGAFMTRYMDHRIFDPLLGCALLVGAGVLMLRPALKSPATPAAGTRRLVERTGVVQIYSPRIGLGMLMSVGVGFASSLLGIGGGIIHVPLMIAVLGFPAHIATATSHFVLALLSLAAVIVHAEGGTLQPALGRALPLAVGAIAGAPAGAALSSRVPGRWLLWGLAAALASVGIHLLFVH